MPEKQGRETQPQEHLFTMPFAMSSLSLITSLPMLLHAMALRSVGDISSG